MRAVLLKQPKELEVAEIPTPEPQDGELLLKVEACAVCRTDLHILDGELPLVRSSLILGHQIVARVEGWGRRVEGFALGERVGVPWLGWACGTCRYCQMGLENLCERAEFTGYHRQGGYAEYAVADAHFVHRLAEGRAEELAPLLCGGLIGYRAYRMAPGERLGLYGFGSAAHLLAQLARAEGRAVYAFTRPGDHIAQAWARELGVTWAGGSDELPPEPLDAAIVFAPVGALLPQALRAVRPGGVVVAGGIHMSEIPAFPYALLWGERVLRSVANVTREDGREFFAKLNQVAIRPRIRVYPLEQAGQALADLRAGLGVGTAVLVP